MTVATGSSSIVGNRVRRKASPGRRRALCKTLLRTAMTTTVAVAIAITALAATSRLLFAAREARLETRSLIGVVPSPGLRWFAWRDTGMVPLAMAEAPAASATGSLAGPLVFAALPASGTLNEASDDALLTGSIGKPARFDAAVEAPAPRFAGFALSAETRALPIPRARPRLAALSPAGIDLRPNGEEAPSPRTAIYDITAQTVYMPNGERLEAHSGYGQFMDDPKYVRLRMRGVTPPNTYRLTMREALFHGVEAIRMTPEDKAAMFGRNGILAHSYMLGPNGQSNGCVSFKDYAKFLAAFKRGEVDRMVVVFRLSRPPAFYARRNIKSAANTL